MEQKIDVLEGRIAWHVGVHVTSSVCGYSTIPKVNRMRIKECHSLGACSVPGEGERRRSEILDQLLYGPDGALSAL